MSSEVIKEFLIALGVDVKQSEVKKFDDFIRSTSKRMVEFAQVAAATAVEVQASVTLIADQFEKLYYSSQRTRTSVGAIQSLQFGAQQVGVSAEAATAALEKMARAVQLQPGLGGLLANLGVDPNQKDKTEQMLQLVERLGKMPAYIGSQYAGMLGIDDRTFQMLALQAKEVRASREEYRKFATEAGMDPDKLAHDSREFMNETRRLEAVLMLFGMQVESSLLPIVKRFTEALTYLQNLINGMNKWARDTLPGGGALPAIEGTAGAIVGTMLAKRAISSILGKLGVGAASAAGAAVGAAGGWGTSTVTGFAGGTALSAAEGAQVSLLARILIGIQGLATGIAGSIASVLLPGLAGGLLAYAGINATTERRNAKLAEVETATGAMNDYLLHKNKPIVKLHNPGNLRVGHGFESDYAGFVAMAQQILIDADRGQVTLASLLGGLNGKGGWSPASENNTPELIKKMSERLHVAPGTVLNMKDPATLAMVMRAIAVQEVGNRDATGKLYDYDMVQRAAAEAAAHHHSRSVTVVQHNDTVVHGVPDAHGVHREVKDAHSVALRHLKSAVN